MKKNILSFLSIAVILSGLLVMSSCKKDDAEESTGQTEYRVKMTDAPGNFTEVNVHIKQIRVHNDAQGWIDLPTTEGVYNLLDFANGIDTLIASSTMPSGTVSQIRFVLGDSNSVVVDGVTHDLTVPSGEQSGLKLQVHQELIPDLTYTVLIDFDAAMSVVLTGNGKYILKPSLKVITQGIDGGITGDLDPNGVFANIYAVKGTDTTGGVPDSLGMYTINGLEPGTYDVIINPVSPYKPDTIKGVSVTAGVITNVGVTTLQQ